MGTAADYVRERTLTNSTLENCVVANPNLVSDLCNAFNVYCATGGVVKNARVFSQGGIYNRDYNGYIEKVHVSNGGTIILRSANASAQDIYISSGALVYCQYGPKYTNVEIFDGGTFYQNSGTVNNMIVHAGGVVGGWNGPAATVWNGLTVDAGASFTTYANFTMMGNVSIAEGAWTNSPAAHTVNGVLTDLTLGVNATFSTGVALANVTWTGGNVNFFNVAISGYTQNTNQAIVRSAGASVTNADVKVGNLYIQDGAVGSNIRVSNGASLQVTNMAAGATLKDITVSAGGSMGNSVWCVYENVDVQDGAHWTLGNSFDIHGDINIAAGALTNDADATAAHGVIENLDLGLTGNFGSGITLSNFNQTGGTLYFQSAAMVKDATLASYSYFRKGASGNNVTVTAGEVDLDPQSAVTGDNRVFVDGLRMTGGTVIVKWAGTVLSNAQVSGGILYGRSQGIIRNVDIYNGGELRIANQGDAVISGAVVHTGGKLTQGMYTQFTDLTVEAGGSLSLSNNFDIQGDVNIATGGLVNDADAYAANGTIYDLNLGITGNFRSGVTLSNFTQTAGTIYIAPDAAVETAALTGGTLTIAAGATGKNITQNAGTLDIAAGADVDGVTYNGGTFNIATGVTVKNLNKNGAGAVNLYGNAVVDGGVMTAGQLQALAASGANGARIKNYIMRAPGANYLILRGNNLFAENIAVSGGSLCIQAGASATNIDVYEGGVINTPGHQPGAQYTNLNIHSGGNGLLVATANAQVNIGGLAMEQGAQLSITSARISGAAITGGELTVVGSSNYLSGGATIDNLTVKGTGWLWLNDPYNAAGGAVYDPIHASSLNVDTGAYVFMHGTNVTASDTVVGGFLYVQNGAVASGGEILDGGYLNSWKRGGYNDPAARAKTIGMTVRSGGTAAATDCDFVNMTVEDGATLALNTNAAIGGTMNTIAAGTVLVGGTLDADAHTDENHVLRDLDVSASVLDVNSGIALADLNIGHAGVINATDATITNFDVEAPEQTTGGRLYLYSGTVASGGRINGMNKVGVMDMTGGAKFNEAYVSGGSIFLSANAEITNVEQTGGAVILRGSQTYVSKATVLGGGLYVQNGGSGDDITVAGGKLVVQDTAMTNPAGKVEVVNGVTMTTGQIEVSSGGTINGLTATGGRIYAFSSSVINVQTGGALNDLQAYTGAKINFVENKTVATFTGENTNIAEGTLYFNNSVVAGHAANGVLEGFNADNSTLGYKLSIGSGIVLKNAIGNNTAVRVSAFDGAVVSGMTLRGGAIICVNNADVRVLDTTLTGEAGAGQTCNLNLSAGAYASNTVVQANAKIQFQHADGRADNTTIMAGGSMVTSNIGVGMTAKTGDLITLDFTGATVSRVYIDSLAHIADETKVVLKGETAGVTYTIADTGATDKYVNCGDWGLYDDRIKAGETITNAFTSMTYDFNAAGTAIEVTGVTVGTQTAAGALTSDDAITGGRATKWDGTTAVTSGNVFLAGDMASGDAWLEIDDGYVGGANSATTLYGASDSSFAGTVNILAKGGAIRNLAAGAANGGSVGAVKLTFDGATLAGAGYAGGFGNVTGETETLVTTGTFAKDFYAGALANKLTTTTSVDDVSMTIDGGTFSGNIYGASAIKTDTTKGNGTRHTAGDVTLTVTGGETTKGTQACIFAGGYATGNATGTVYTVDSVTATISGGSWGEAAGGRGIFGGIMASGVEAEVLGNVNITVSGGTMGNVYGGGWAQKTGGKSIVGNVNINIDGGTIANVFGGGSHSTSGGSTEAGDITITVSGGNITGTIYARGQLDGDTTGAANVIFTGTTDFSCDVFGYSYVGGEASDATLAFNTYAGEFSGSIGGFNSIAFSGNTALTLTTAQDKSVSNKAWEFDFTRRDAEFSDTAFLNGAILSESNTVAVSFADEAQAKGGWSIAGVTVDTGASATFDLTVGTDTIATNLAYGTAISGGAYDGWGFELESGVLKFAQITA